MSRKGFVRLAQEQHGVIWHYFSTLQQLHRIALTGKMKSRYQLRLIGNVLVGNLKCLARPAKSDGRSRAIILTHYNTILRQLAKRNWRIVIRLLRVNNSWLVNTVKCSIVCTAVEAEMTILLAVKGHAARTPTDNYTLLATDSHRVTV
jgi:hypothetical protein